jgi:hypothetical protein
MTAPTVLKRGGVTLGSIGAAALLTSCGCAAAS